MGCRQQKGKINGLSNHWIRGTPDAHPKVPPHKCREHHDTTTVGRIGVDIYTATKCDVWPISTANQTSAKRRNHGAIPICPKVSGRILSALEDDLLRDIFTANMTDPETQKELLKVTLDPEKALELAISIELGARSQLGIQAKHTSDPSMVSIVGRSEPVLAILSSRYLGNFRGNYSRPRGTFTQPRGNNNQSFTLPK